MRHIFQRLLPRRLWLAGLPCLALFRVFRRRQFNAETN
ncbi:hypothetical protein ACUODJ_12520, partial [Escherichia sp. HC-CC]